jgi:hypothetical protein
MPNEDGGVGSERDEESRVPRGNSPGLIMLYGFP